LTRLPDFPLFSGDLSMLKQSIADNTAKLAVITDHKLRVDEVLAPLLREIENLESKLNDIQWDHKVAEDFDQRLSFAENSYERALIHQQCEEWFGKGSPRKIISEKQREIRQLERNYDKARRRVEEVAKKAARRIDKVIIDGNNLCYAGNDFIGLAAIEAILPLLSRMCEVVVVFDSTIRRLLSTDNDGLQKRLASFSEVHVVASRKKADETVLDLASANEFIYVISNDRFGDFNDKSAVKNGRLIKHEVVSGNVFVHDLQLRAAYREETEKCRLA
jgi:rRNA-processing protein FCF1